MKRQNADVLGEVSLGFVPKDRISNMIRYQRRLDYPYGRDLNGVEFEYQQGKKQPDTVCIIVLP